MRDFLVSSEEFILRKVSAADARGASHFPSSADNFTNSGIISSNSGIISSNGQTETTNGACKTTNGWSKRAIEWVKFTNGAIISSNGWFWAAKPAILATAIVGDDVRSTDRKSESRN